MAGARKNRREERIKADDWVNVEHNDKHFQAQECSMLRDAASLAETVEDVEYLTLMELEVAGGKSITQMVAGAKPFDNLSDINKPWAVCKREDDGITVKFLHMHPQHGIAFNVKQTWHFEHVMLNGFGEAARIMFDVKAGHPEVADRIYLYNVYTGVESWFFRKA